MSCKSKLRPIQSTRSEIPQSTTTPSDADQQFEVELYWCIQQLQTALRLGKLKQKQAQEHTRALNTLMSKTAPLVKKRQVMRLSFGDYRSKMSAEEKKYARVNGKVKLLPSKPSPKSVFVKKSASVSTDNKNIFKFNFDVTGIEEHLEDKNESKSGKNS